MLPRVSRTFALSIRLLHGSFREAVEIGYLLCRSADALEDTLPGDPRRIEERFGMLARALDGDPEAARMLAEEACSAPHPDRDDLVLLAHLPRVLAVYRALSPGDRGALRECLQVMIEGMSRYASRAAGRDPSLAYLDTEGELHDYCWVVAGCVGVMLTRLFNSRSPARDTRGEAARFALAPVVGEALQLTNILLDWPADVRRGRCFVPAAWLAEHGLVPAELVGRERPGVRALAQRLESRARAALARVPDYVDLLPARHVRYRLFCVWPALWAARSLDRALTDREFPWGERRPKLTRREVWSSALGSALVAMHRERLRRYFVDPTRAALAAG